MVRENLGDAMCAAYRKFGIFAHERPVLEVVDRLEALERQWMHAMHGGSLTRDAIPYYTQALREQPFAYDGRLFGRDVVAPEETVLGVGAPQP